MRSTHNSGLVLLSAYIPQLFERLNLVKEQQFVSPETQLRAVHHLQFLATGLSHTGDAQLALNKVLCGLPQDAMMTPGIEISDEERKLIEGLLHAAISQWPEIGETSIAGFRGNWLVRNGILNEPEDKWELIVEKKPYDVLLYKFPLPFSVISYPWMSKHLHVNWAF